MLDWIHAIISALGIGGAFFLAIIIWRQGKEVTSAKTELVVEKQISALLRVTNDELRSQLEREKQARKIIPIPEISEHAPPEEVISNLRNSLRTLSGLPPFSDGVPLPEAGTTEDDNHLPGNRTVLGETERTDANPSNPVGIDVGIDKTRPEKLHRP